MDDIYLSEKRKKIILLEDEIKTLEEKKNQLNGLYLEYYNDYYNLKRDDYSLLTNLPFNPTSEKHILFDYSYLNVDTIGEIICELVKRYDKLNYISRRVVRHEIWDSRIGTYNVELPRLVVGTQENVEKEDNNIRYYGENEEEASSNIVIKFSEYVYLKNYPTDKPVKWNTSSVGDIYERSNYCPLIGYSNCLTFDYHNLEYIKELIYSLAYYQREHNKKYMSSQETVKVYKKIYK